LNFDIMTARFVSPEKLTNLGFLRSTKDKSNGMTTMPH
jgi:hypothetical protein